MEDEEYHQLKWEGLDGSIVEDTSDFPTLDREIIIRGIGKDSSIRRIEIDLKEKELRYCLASNREVVESIEGTEVIKIEGE